MGGSDLRSFNLSLTGLPTPQLLLSPLNPDASSPHRDKGYDASGANDEEAAGGDGEVEIGRAHV